MSADFVQVSPPGSGTAEVPDYESLARDEVAELLDDAAAARARGDWQKVARLAVRLRRAMPGNASPKQIDTPVAMRGARLNRLFAERYTEGGTPELTAAVWAVLTEDAAGGSDG